MNRLSLCSMAVILLAGCAATPYQPTNSNGYGYADQQLSRDTYTVVFVANSATNQQQVDDFALLHAAELGAAQGYAYMSVTNKKSGIFMLAPPRATSGSYMPSTSSGGQASGMGMMRMSGGGAYGGSGYGGGSGPDYSAGGSSPSANPARACSLTVRFSADSADASGKPAQQIQPLVAKLKAEYGLTPGGAGY
jgi:hypothetical protein